MCSRHAGAASRIQPQPHIPSHHSVKSTQPVLHSKPDDKAVPRHVTLEPKQSIPGPLSAPIPYDIPRTCDWESPLTSNWAYQCILLPVNGSIFWTRRCNSCIWLSGNVLWCQRGSGITSATVAQLGKPDLEVAQPSNGQWSPHLSCQSNTQ